MSFEKPLSDFPSSDPIIDATTTNKILEKQIKKTPEQYLWIHRRFKTRPEGAKTSIKIINNISLEIQQLKKIEYNSVLKFCHIQR